MKITDKKKPVKTVPKGVWEGSRPEKNKTNPETLTTDLQGNGYPKNQQGS